MIRVKLAHSFIIYDKVYFSDIYVVFFFQCVLSGRACNIFEYFHDNSGDLTVKLPGHGWC